MKKLGVELEQRQRATLGIYVHVPFCSSICSYCDFTKTGHFSKPDVDVFFLEAERQLNRLLFEVKPRGEVATLYFGGGTPGMFPAERFAPLVAAARRVFEVEECTLEMNPLHVSKGRFRAFRDAGIDRITLGAQSLSAPALQYLGRRHDARMVLSTLERAREEGMEQVQVDLIYGLKDGLRSEGISDEIRILEAAGATGISAYALTIESRTRLGFQQDQVQCDETICREYQEIVRSCAELGFRQIETSNFSRFEAKHNNLYWNGWPYLGVGTGAHGLLPSTVNHPFGIRYQVGHSFAEQGMGDDRLPFASDASNLFDLVWESERLEQHYRDEMFYTLLRTPKGILHSWMHEWNWEEVWRAWRLDERLQRACDARRLVMDDAGIRLNGNEFLLGDGWSSHLSAIADRVKPCRSTWNR